MTERRPRVPSSQLADKDNIGEILLSHHQTIIDAQKRAEDEAKKQEVTKAEASNATAPIALQDNSLSSTGPVPQPKSLKEDLSQMMQIQAAKSQNALKSDQNIKCYHKWCKEIDFELKLPEDILTQKKASNQAKQGSLDPHLQAITLKEKAIIYSDKLFMKTAVEWLILTNQLLTMFEHPKFIAMINIASRATNGNPAGVGKVSLTCDAWQASNIDAYFAVTGRWIEEHTLGVWEEKSGILGFVLMNTAHDGVRLGRTLYKVTKWLGITGKAVISVYSPSKHYDPANPQAHEPDLVNNDRDVVGVVWSIVVKVRSSAQRKETFKSLQRNDAKFEGKEALTLLIDMKVRWSSTFVMLQRSYLLKKYIDAFLWKISQKERNCEKQAKLLSLRLSSEEWNHVKMFIRLLQLADRAQQAFSAENAPTLHNALPALEALHEAWSSRQNQTKYLEFADALGAGVAKLEQYYQKTSETHAYTLAMFLDPNIKMEYFRKHWDKDLEDEVLESVKIIFKEQYKNLQKTTTMPQPLRRTQHQSKLCMLLDKNSSGDEDDNNCSLRSELLFRDSGPFSLVEEELEVQEDDEDDDWRDIEDSKAWDMLLDSDSDDDEI
ncbi:hypothetical protein H0H92_012141 [Tricholoma furcatifolium]|nr:hypothetical protein H0H92_012141 [Tricholoma furcatifolium]